MDNLSSGDLFDVCYLKHVKISIEMYRYRCLFKESNLIEIIFYKNGLFNGDWFNNLRYLAYGRITFAGLLVSNKNAVYSQFY